MFQQSLHNYRTNNLTNLCLQLVSKHIRNTESTAVVYLNSFVCNVPGGLGGEDLGDGGLHVEVLVASVHKHRSFYLAAKEQSRFI